MSRKVVLPSRAELEIQLAPLAVSKALYMALLEAMIPLKMNGSEEFDANLIKDVVCSSLSSKAIDACVDACMNRCLYNGEKITDQTFEPAEARQDYLLARYEVAYDNVLPFLSGLLSKYKDEIAKVRAALNTMFATKTA